MEVVILECVKCIIIKNSLILYVSNFFTTYLKKITEQFKNKYLKNNNDIIQVKGEKT